MTSTEAAGRRMVTGLVLAGVVKRFGEVLALNEVSLDIREGEFVTLLGPSGCGKTTLLRIVAGFEWPDRGSVTLDGVEISGMPPYRRPVNTVFQRPILLPHLDVFENIAFGLRATRVRKDQIGKRVREMLAVIRLSDYERRPSDALSGGEAQRVSLARALVNRPRALLLDEPLSALDLQVRLEMQAELKRIHRETGTTFLYVTHDQQEAMAMSDRIAVMRDGALKQVGTPDEIYHAPRSSFVARFVGNANVVPIEAVVAGDTPSAHIAGTDVRLRVVDLPADRRDGYLSLRPESLSLTRAEASDLHGILTDLSFLGASVLWRVAVGEHEVRVTGESANGFRASIGERVGIQYDPHRVRYLAD
jgi:ABC-type Fe3+/spermidine/putrescine transport system ATPase subunit